MEGAFSHSLFTISITHLVFQWFWLKVQHYLLLLQIYTIHIWITLIHMKLGTQYKKYTINISTDNKTTCKIISIQIREMSIISWIVQLSNFIRYPLLRWRIKDYGRKVTVYGVHYANQKSMFTLKSEKIMSILKLSQIQNIPCSYTLSISVQLCQQYIRMHWRLCVPND